MTLSRRNLLVGSGLVLAELSLALPASATTALYLTIPQLKQRSARVVLGRPVLKESEWATVGQSRRIITRTRFMQSSNWLQGDSPDEPNEDEFEIVTLGGRVGSLAQKVPGEAHLPVGDEVLLFVGEGTKNQLRVIGMGQGAYPIKRTGGSPELSRSRQLPHLVGPHRDDTAPEMERPAIEVLHRAQFSRAFSLIRQAK